MARLQILELPEGAGDDRPPYLLIIDQVDEATADDIARWPNDSAERTGARHILCFSETIDIPANEIALSDLNDAADGNVVRLRVEPDLTGFHEMVMAEVARAQATARAAAL
ncbi:hypothetical protein ACWGDX_13140 [Streptomyces sp. NPDC055025]